MMKQLVYLALSWALLFSGSILLAQSSDRPIWKSVDESTLSQVNRQIIPTKYKTVGLDLEKMKSILEQAPSKDDFLNNREANRHVIELPMPDGSTQSFAVFETPVMAPALAAQYPQIRTYSAVGIDDPTAYVKLDYTLKGFHALIHSVHGETYIDPYSKGDTQNYVSYYKKDFHKPHSEFSCGIEGHSEHSPERGTSRPSLSIDGQTRRYRLALACTGEYAQFHGGNVPSVLSEYNTAINRVNSVTEIDLGLTFELISNTSSLIFLNGSTDPYSNQNGGAMLGQNQSTVDNIIGSANYDIGHVFSTGGGGIAGLGVVCINGQKARGVTGLPSPVGDPFYIDYVAHEMGHQFGGNHTFNGSTGSCSGARNASTAFEPGSGTTVMAYAGICPGQNIQNNSSDYYHTGSFQEVVEYMHEGFGNTCANITSSNNQAPVVDPGLTDLVVPASTPLQLTGSGTDPDGDVLTFCWEQVDLGPQGSPTSPSGNAAIFRSFPPISEPTRYLPRLNELVNNTTPFGEILPSYDRILTFRLMARDNNPNGCGVTYEEVEFSVTDDAGPFLVTAPNTPTSWVVNDFEEVTWDVADTDVAPVECETVDIILSNDGGFTYTDTLLKNTPNDGSAIVQVPNSQGSFKRVMVHASENIFFDISNFNFSVQNAANPDIATFALVEEVGVCPGTIGEFQVLSAALGGYNGTVALNSANLPSGATATLVPANPTAGDTITVLIEGDNTLAPGTYPVTFIFGGTGGEADFVTLDITVFTGLPTSVAQALPADGQTQISRRPTFSWDEIPGASGYFLEVSNNPSFDQSSILIAEDVDATQYHSDLEFDALTPYYWRVRARNICGLGPFAGVHAFQVGSCTFVNSFDVPQSIPIFGNPAEVTSSTFVPLTGSVTDINIKDVDITHGDVDQLAMTLTSPDGTEIPIFPAGTCDDTEDLLISFDDEASLTIVDIECPATNGQSYAPPIPLSSFDGESTGSGVTPWTLKILDNVQFDGGTLNSWTLEVCTQTAAAPLIVNNNVLWIGAGNQGTIFTSNLLADDGQNQPNNLTFTLVSVPDSGDIQLNGSVLGTGETFSQEDINNGNLTYVSTGTEPTPDQFLFTVENNQGGWAGTPVFQIDVVATYLDDKLGFDWGVYPNPASDQLSIRVEDATLDGVKFEILNLQGQSIWNSTVNQIHSNYQKNIDISAFAPGLYMVRMSNDQGYSLKRLVISK